MRLYNDIMLESQLVYGDHTEHLNITILAILYSIILTYYPAHRSAVRGQRALPGIHGSAVCPHQSRGSQSGEYLLYVILYYLLLYIIYSYIICEYLYVVLSQVNAYYTTRSCYINNSNNKLYWQLKHMQNMKYQRIVLQCFPSVRTSQMQEVITRKLLMILR